ncbi:MAG: hypothetical protein P4M14_12525 [Gammaproteobacteria bacterium]|nr:hypothetical protein [Gammaproteobacteria bacterium]
MIDSSNRYSRATTSPSDCVIPSNEVLSGTYSLKSITLPVTYYNVNNTNNTIYWTDTGGACTCQIPIGFYNTYSTFASAVATAMTANGVGTVTCTASSLTNCLTVANTVAFQFTFGTNTRNSAATLMGFNGDSPTSVATQVASTLIDLATALSYNFLISEAVNGIKVIGGQQFTFSTPDLTQSLWNGGETQIGK